MLGDLEDFRVRLRKLIPFSWFPRPSPVLWGFLTGAASVFASSYTQIKYAKAQTRMATATDAFLDIAGMDYIGSRMPRRTGESDNSYRYRIVTEALRIRNTRQAIMAALMDLTARAPQIVEPWNGIDTGFLNQTIFLAGGAFPGIGVCGSTSMPFTVFVTAYRPIVGEGLTVPDSEIYAMVNNVRAAGITAWVRIQN